MQRPTNLLLCALNISFAFAITEYLEQKAVLYGTFALAFGLFLHVSPIPPVKGGPLVTKILTENVEALTGGKVVLE
ncbi:MAG: hypothetical protein NZ583_08945 [Desulfobacterota bacterium]|nr:hypothetical protein [Thermodesulfobacteriota bacterium]MDW8002969.1 hypothetical protein [Deltaproteobacteria bacterium]